MQTLQLGRAGPRRRPAVPRAGRCQPRSSHRTAWQARPRSACAMPRCRHPPAAAAGQSRAQAPLPPCMCPGAPPARLNRSCGFTQAKQSLIRLCPPPEPWGRHRQAAGRSPGAQPSLAQPLPHRSCCVFSLIVFPIFHFASAVHSQNYNRQSSEV